MRENWNDLLTLNDLDYAAQSLGFHLLIDHTVTDFFELHPKKGYWPIDVPSIAGSKEKIKAFLIGFDTMREIHYKKWYELDAQITKIMFPFGRPE